MRPLWCLLLLACIAVIGGCTTSMSAGYFLPTANASYGGDTLDLEDDLGVAPDQSIIWEVYGDFGRQRLRANWLRVMGSGTVQAASGFTFGGVNVASGENVDTEALIDAAQFYYEPAIMMRPNMRLRLLLGVELLQVHVTLTNTDTTDFDEIYLPGTDSTMRDYGVPLLPLPVAGLNFETALRPPHLKLLARGAYYNSELVGLTGEYEGAMLVGDVAVVWGNYNANLAVGYRYLDAEFTDGGYTAGLSGLYGSVILSF